MGEVLVDEATAGAGRSDLSVNLVSTVDMLEPVKESRGLTANRARRIKRINYVGWIAGTYLGIDTLEMSGAYSQGGIASRARAYVRGKLLHAQHSKGHPGRPRQRFWGFASHSRPRNGATRKRGK